MAQVHYTSLECSCGKMFLGRGRNPTAAFNEARQRLFYHTTKEGAGVIDPHTTEGLEQAIDAIESLMPDVHIVRREYG